MPPPQIPISWCDPRLIRRVSPIQGEGVFALAPIAAGELVIVFGGHVLSFSDLASLETLNPSAHRIILDTGYQIADDLIYSPVDETQLSIAECLNYSCLPNCGFSSEITLVAMRDILADEELSMDYALCISHAMFAMDCNCGVPGCRRSLSVEDWRNPILQARYRGYFQPYLERKISSGEARFEIPGYSNL